MGSHLDISTGAVFYHGELANRQLVHGVVTDDDDPRVTSFAQPFPTRGEFTVLFGAFRFLISHTKIVERADFVRPPGHQEVHDTLHFLQWSSKNHAVGDDVPHRTFQSSQSTSAKNDGTFLQQPIPVYNTEV